MTSMTAMGAPAFEFASEGGAAGAAVGGRRSESSETARANLGE